MNLKEYDIWLKTEEELLGYIHELENQPMNYNSAAENVAKATVAMFNYMASKLVISGFQAGWVGMRFLQVVKNMEAPFMIVDGSKILYPQYDLIKDVEKFIEEIKPEIGKIAKEKLETEADEHTHENVLKRWKELAEHAE